MLSLIAYTFWVNQDFVFFIITLCSLWWVQMIGYVLACRSYLFVCALPLSALSFCKLIWRNWTYKMPVRYISLSGWVRLSIFPQLSIIQYMELCVFSLPIFLMMIGRMYILCLMIIIKSEVWNIIHCLGLGHETMVCAVCPSIFLQIIPMIWKYSHAMTLSFHINLYKLSD